MFTKKTGLIIPTRNRPENLNLTLEFFLRNNIKFYKIIIIDSSEKKLRKQIRIICKKFKVSLFFSKPSTSLQRNMGLKKLSKINVEFVMFLDDDLKFYKNSFIVMNKYIKKYKNNYKGFCFNYTDNNKRSSLLEKIKTSRIVEKIGLYSKKKGTILDSGWQTKIKNISYNLTTQWLPSSSSIFKKDIIKGKFFAETFGVYSYLEDLEFSMQLNPKRENCFLVISGSKFTHLKDVIRTSFNFGYYELRNRHKIVKKFHLNKISFYKMAICKTILTFLSIILNYKNIYKFSGNIFAIICCLIFG
jgi:hypothetical protein